MSSPDDPRERARAQIHARLRPCVEVLGITPTPAQARFLLDDLFEVLYGGAAGGGKSMAMLLGAVMYVDVPGYSALVFRRTLTELALPNGLMGVARGLIGDRAAWNNDTHTLTFPSGATLTFGYLDTTDVMYRYQGAEFQYIGFDELTHFDEEQYLYLFSRLRGPADDADPLARVPLRIRATANPGGRGHDWVKARFIDRHDNDPQRAFHPATLDDNPHLDQAQYRQTLERLGPIKRAQLLHGDWNKTPNGRLFQRAWFPTIHPSEIPDDLELVRYWDLAATAPTAKKDHDYTVGVLAGRDTNGLFYVLDVTRARLDVPHVRRLLATTAAHDGDHVQIWIEEEPGSSGKLLINDLRTGPLEGYDVRSDRPTGAKTTRAEFLAGRAGDGYVKLKPVDWNESLIDELVLFPDGRHDDQVDALTGAIKALTEHPRIDFIGDCDFVVERDDCDDDYYDPDVWNPLDDTF